MPMAGMMPTSSSKTPKMPRPPRLTTHQSSSALDEFALLARQSSSLRADNLDSLSVRLRQKWRFTNLGVAAAILKAVNTRVVYKAQQMADVSHLLAVNNELPVEQSIELEFYSVEMLDRRCDLRYEKRVLAALRQWLVALVKLIRAAGKPGVDLELYSEVYTRIFRALFSPSGSKPFNEQEARSAVRSDWERDCKGELMPADPSGWHAHQIRCRSYVQRRMHVGTVRGTVD